MMSSYLQEVILPDDDADFRRSGGLFLDISNGTVLFVLVTTYQDYNITITTFKPCYGVLQPFANKGNLQLYGWNGKERVFLVLEAILSANLSHISNPSSHTLSGAKCHVIQSIKSKRTCHSESLHIHRHFRSIKKFTC